MSSSVAPSNLAEASSGAEASAVAGSNNLNYNDFSNDGNDDNNNNNNNQVIDQNSK